MLLKKKLIVFVPCLLAMIAWAFYQYIPPRNDTSQKEKVNISEKELKNIVKQEDTEKHQLISPVSNSVPSMSSDPQHEVADPNSKIPISIPKQVMSKEGVEFLPEDDEERRNKIEQTNPEMVAFLEKIQRELESRTPESVAQPPFNQQEYSSISEGWNNQKTTQQKIVFLGSMSMHQDNDSLENMSVLKEALEDADPQVNFIASLRLSRSQSPDALPVIEQAMQNASDEVKVNLLEPLGKIHSPEAESLLVMGIEDPAIAVRNRALDVAKQQTDEIQLNVLDAGILSDYKDVKNKSLSMLESRADKASISTIMKGLNDPDELFVKRVNLTLRFLINQEFESYDQAISWWQSNSDRYAGNLIEKHD